MINDGSAVLKAGGRDWSFRITVGQWMKLQTHFGGGPDKVSGRFSGDDWLIEDLREVIERGLEGGGMPADEAREKATEIMDCQPLDTNYKLVMDVLGAAWTGLAEYLKKKAAVEAAQTALSRIEMGNGTSPDFSDTESLPASSPRKRKASVSASSSP